MSLNEEQQKAILEKPLTAPLTHSEANFIRGCLRRQMLIHEYLTAMEYWSAADLGKARQMLGRFTTSISPHIQWIADLPDPMPNEWQPPTTAVPAKTT